MVILFKDHLNSDIILFSNLAFFLALSVLNMLYRKFCHAFSSACYRCTSVCTLLSFDKNRKKCHQDLLLLLLKFPIFHEFIPQNVFSKNPRVCLDA